MPRLPLPALLALISSCTLFLCTPPARAELKKDIEFARPGGFALTLDAFVPEGKGPFPAVIIVHGGGFVNGDKTTYVPPLFQPLSDAGFAWFTINYRLATKAPHPAANEDLEAAVLWVKKNAKQYKVDPNRIALMGESAGGTIVAYGAVRMKGKAKVKAVVDFYGVNDWEFNAEAREGGLTDNAKLFLGQTALRDASAITYVYKDMPPFLFIHGTKDTQVPYAQSPRMCKAMLAVGARCEVFTIEGAPHGVGPWEKVPEFQSYKKKMVDWLKIELK